MYMIRWEYTDWERERDGIRLCDRNKNGRTLMMNHIGAVMILNCSRVCECSKKTAFLSNHEIEFHAVQCQLLPFDCPVC